MILDTESFGMDQEAAMATVIQLQIKTFERPVRSDNIIIILISCKLLWEETKAMINRYDISRDIL